MRFVAKNALISGGTSGIGKATALAMAQEGGRVVIVGRRLQTAAAVVTQIEAAGGRGLAIACDITLPDEVAACAARVSKEVGPLQVIVNAAGSGGELQAVTEVDEAAWSAMLELNLNGAYRVCRAFIGEMAKNGGGSIVNVSSIGGLEAVPRAAPYVSAKTALIGLTRSLALDYAEHGIRANCVCPGYVDTPLLQKVIAAQPDPRKTRVQWTGLHPLGRIGRPEDIANAILFLASEQASWITGVTLPVDGGYLLSRTPGAHPDLG